MKIPLLDKLPHVEIVFISFFAGLESEEDLYSMTGYECEQVYRKWGWVIHAFICVLALMIAVMIMALILRYYLQAVLLLLLTLYNALTFVHLLRFFRKIKWVQRRWEENHAKGLALKRR